MTRSSQRVGQTLLSAGRQECLPHRHLPETSVRITDILRLSLSALWQQKVRTILTTLGVVFGTFVLVASLSINRGVEETVVREYGRHGALSRIMVYPGLGRPKAGPEVEVKGEMSAARRERLRQELQRHQPYV